MQNCSQVERRRCVVSRSGSHNGTIAFSDIARTEISSDARPVRAASQAARAGGSRKSRRVDHIPPPQPTTSLNARGATATFGTACWYDDPLAMIHSDEIDIVSVCVKVPDHRALAVAAASSGKAT